MADQSTAINRALDNIRCLTIFATGGSIPDLLRQLERLAAAVEEVRETITTAAINIKTGSDAVDNLSTRTGPFSALKP